MRIQRILLLVFLLLLFLAIVPIAALSFYASRQALEAEISRNLQNDAEMLMKQIDMLMFERLQNVHSWSHLDIVQEGRIGDVDKRLAQFLADLQHSYPGVYRDLFYLDPLNRIVAAADPSRIGSSYQPQPDWIQAEVPHGEVMLEALQLQPPYQQADLAIRASIPDIYGTGDIGQLYGIFDLRQILHLFDQASFSESGDRFIVLLDRQGRAIAGSAGVRDKSLLLGNHFAEWRSSNPDHTRVHAGQPLTDAPVLVGYATSGGYQSYAKLGWSLLVIQSTQQAFRPIQALWWLFSGVFLVTALIASGIAQGVARRIAQPLLDLTGWVCRFRQAADNRRPKVAGALEVRELSIAFGQLLEDLERSRQQVIHAAKLAVIGEMAAIMAHEVRTPLGILQTTAQMLQREPGLGEDGRDMTRMIVEESARLNRLISALLDCARPRPPDMQSHDLSRIMMRVAELLAKQAEKKGIRVEWPPAGQSVSVECDEELLVQVFLNLVLNAIQILPNGGHIRLNIDDSDAACVSISVADDGPGIPPENRDRLFDPFFTTREGGIGLGLTVTQQIIALHGGRIGAEASDLGGACFRLLFPRHQG